jgi:hypothetical protein
MFFVAAKLYSKFLFDELAGLILVEGVHVVKHTYGYHDKLAIVIYKAKAVEAVVANQEVGVQELINGCGGGYRGYRAKRTIDVVFAQFGTYSAFHDRFNGINMLLTIGRGDHQT